MAKNFFIDALINDISWAYLKDSDWEEDSIPDILFEKINHVSEKVNTFFKSHEIYYSVNRKTQKENLIIQTTKDNKVYTDRFWGVNTKQQTGSILLNFLYHFRNTVSPDSIIPLEDISFMRKIVGYRNIPTQAMEFYNLDGFTQLVSNIYSVQHCSQFIIEDESKEAMASLLWNDFLLCTGEEHSVDRIKRIAEYIYLCADKDLHFNENEVMKLSVINHDKLPRPIPIVVMKRKLKEETRRQDVGSTLDRENLYTLVSKNDDVSYSEAVHYKVYSLTDIFYATLLEFIHTDIKLKRCDICRSIISSGKSYCEWENTVSLINLRNCRRIARSTSKERKELPITAERLYKKCKNKLKKRIEWATTDEQVEVRKSSYNTFIKSADDWRNRIKNEQSKRSILTYYWIIKEYVQWLEEYDKWKLREKPL